MEEDWTNHLVSPLCSFCGKPSGGYVVNRETRTAWCEECFALYELPKLQAQYPDNWTPIAVLLGIGGIYILAMVVEVLIYIFA